VLRPEDSSARCSCLRLSAETSCAAVGLRRSPNPAAVLAGNVADRFHGRGRARRVGLGRATASARRAAGVSPGASTENDVLSRRTFRDADSPLAVSLSSAPRWTILPLPAPAGAPAARVAQRFGSPAHPSWRMADGNCDPNYVPCCLPQNSRKPVGWFCRCAIGFCMAVGQSWPRSCHSRKVASECERQRWSGYCPHLEQRRISFLRAGLVWEAVIITGGLVAGLGAFLLGRQKAAHPPL